MNDIVKITKSSEDSIMLIDRVTETVKHEDFLELCYHL